MKLFNRLLPFLVLGLGVLLAAMVYLNKPESKRRPPRKEELKVEAILLDRQDYPVVIKTQGTVEPRTTTTLIPRVSGEIVEAASNLRPGGFFEKGAVLLRIDPTDYELAIISAEASLAEAHFHLQEESARAKQALRDWNRLGQEGEPSELVLRKPQLDRARALVASAQAQLKKAKLDLNRTRIISPYAGRVLEQFADIGQYVSPGSQLARIFAIDYVEIRLPVTEQQQAQLELPEEYRGDNYQSERAKKVRPLAKVLASIGGQIASWRGQVVRTEGEIDRATRQTFVVVQISDPYGRGPSGRPPLKIGQFVHAEIAGKALQQVLVVPRTAVQGKNSIMVVDADSRLQRRQVRVLWEDKDNIMIREGINDGERLCISYIPFAADNTVVQVKGPRSASGEGRYTAKDTPPDKDKDAWRRRL